LDRSYDPTTLSTDAVAAARGLLGATLVSLVDDTVTAGRIVETEAYFGPGDPASHAAARIGRTARNDPMFGAPGTIYVYRIYGVHRCFNVVTDAPGVPSAVLIRALEPLAGIEAMRARRGREPVASGPGRLSQALGITEALNGHALSAPPVFLAQGTPVPENRVRTTGRVGVTKAGHWPLRFCVADSFHVSSGPHQPGRPDSTLARCLGDLRS